MSVAGAGSSRAALGTVTGARTFLAPAALALRGRARQGREVRCRRCSPPARSSRDKLPMAPPRVEGPGLVGRVVSGALSGRVSGGSRGARVGAAFALARDLPVPGPPRPDRQTHPGPRHRLRRPRGPPRRHRRLSPPPAEPRPSPDPDVDGPKTGDIGEFSAHQHGVLAAAGAWAGGGGCRDGGDDLGAGLALWVHRRRRIGSAGGSGGEDPRHARRQGGQGAAAGAEHRDARPLRDELGPAVRRRLRSRRPAGPAKGLVFGLNVWLASLVELPALGVAPPPWKQPPAALAQDLGFHLVYGAATAAAYEAFTA